MPLLSELTTIVAKALRRPEAQISQVARYAREQGFLTQGARGRHAPHVTDRDAANLLIAACAGGCILKDAPEAISRYRTLKHQLTRGPALFGPREATFEAPTRSEFEFISRCETFGDALEQIIGHFVSGQMQNVMRSIASDYIEPTLLKDLKKRIKGGKDKAAAEELITVCDSFVRISLDFTVTFHRPNPHAAIAIRRRNGIVLEDISYTSFIIHVDDLMKFGAIDGGQREDIHIGYDVLEAVGIGLRVQP